MSIIIFNDRAYSTLYGLAGSAELRALRKRWKLGREVVREEGHPIDEYLAVPASKRANPTLVRVDRETFEAAQTEKMESKTRVTGSMTAVFTSPALFEDFTQPDQRFQHRKGELARKAMRRQRAAQRAEGYA